MEKLSPELISYHWSVQGIDEVSYKWIWWEKAYKDSDISEIYKHLKHVRQQRKQGN